MVQTAYAARACLQPAADLARGTQSATRGGGRTKGLRAARRRLHETRLARITTMKVPFKTKAAIYACFAVIAGALLVVFVALGAAQGVHEGEPHAIVPFSASSTSGIMLSMGALLAFWGLTVKIRCSDRFVRRCLTSIATLFALWMLLVVLKYACSPDLRGFITFTWYFSTFPLLRRRHCALFAPFASLRFPRASPTRSRSALWP